MVARLTFSEALRARERLQSATDGVRFQMYFSGVDEIVNCVADSEEHKQEILRRLPRRQWKADRNGLVSGFTVSFTNDCNQTLGYSVPAVLHGVEWQRALRINRDWGDFRRANFKKVK